MILPGLRRTLLESIAVGILTVREVYQTPHQTTGFTVFIMRKVA